MIKLILFDFDGVICDSDETIWETHNKLLSMHGLPHGSYHSFRRRSGNDSGWVQEQGLDRTDEELQKHFIRLWDPSGCTAIEGAVELVREIGARGIRCAIVSNTAKEKVVAKLSELGIREHFDEVRGSTRHKASALREICDTFDIPVTDALFIGDLACDVRDGRTAGITTVLIAPHDYPYKAEAHHHVTHLRDVMRLLEEP